MAAPQPAHVRLFTADIAAQEEWPRWYYQDLHGELQGPFDAATMSRWCGENALPLDLKCVGIHPQDSGVPPTNLAHFQPLQKLLDNAEAGIRYTPLRLIKGTLLEEGPATPQIAIPGKGNRPSSAGVQSSMQQPSAAVTDVTRAVDQRSMMGSMSAMAAQQLHMQGQGLLQQLQQNTQNRSSQPQQRAPVIPGRQSTQVQQQNRGNLGKRVSTATPTPSQSLHEQHMQHMMQQIEAAGSAKASETDAGDAAVPELLPGNPEWNSALSKLLNREGFTGKDADVKWRVILSSGDRVGPFSPQQMVDWLLNGSPPKGINKQQASQHSANPTALQLAGILGADYNAQRLPGAKFFKPLGQLVPAVAAGMVYAAVNKHDLQRGMPQPGWNDGPGKGPDSAAAAAAAAGPAKGAAGQQAGKAGKGRAASAGGATGPTAGKNKQTPAGNNRPRSAAGAAAGAGVAGFSNHVDGPAAAKPTFQHPMALRQQQRQQRQEGMTAASAAATDAVMGGPKAQPGAAQFPRGSSAVNASGMQTPKGLAGNRQGPASSSASKGILTAANSVGGPAAVVQQQQLTPAQAAAFAAAAGRLGPGGLAQMQQQQLQMQMQGLALGTPTAAYAQSLQQAMWLKQQQVPGQGLLGSYQMYAANAGAPAGMAASMAAAAGGTGAVASQLISNGVLGRTSSTGSSKIQQQLQGEDNSNTLSKGSRGYTAVFQQQQQQDWQQQQYAVAGQVVMPGTASLVPVAGSGPHSSNAPHSSAALMQAAATLFLHDSQQQDQSADAAVERPQVHWWVQRGERAFAGPYSGLQMYQMYLHAVPGSAQFSASTLVAAVSGQPNSRDVPNPRCFVALGVLLEAAMQGYCLVPGNKDSVMQQQPLQVRHVASGMVLPLQQVVPVPLQLLQQRSMSHTPHGGADHGQIDSGGNSDGLQQQKSAVAGGGQMHGGVSPASLGDSRTGSSAGPTSPQQGNRTAAVTQQPKFVATPAGGYVAIAAGAPMRTGAGALGAMGAVPAMGGMLAAPGMSVMAPAAAAAAMDPLSMATALFTSNTSYLWFTMSPSAEPVGPPRTTGPHEPSDMLAMFKDGRLQLSTLVSGVHRALINQQQPQQHRFEPLQMVLASHFAQQQQQQQMNAAAVVAGGQIGQIVPAYVPGAQMGPMLIPVSGAAGGQLMAVPAGIQMQQMQMLPQVQAMAPFLQQGGMLVPQSFMGPTAGTAASVSSAVQPQGPQVSSTAAAGSAPGSSSGSSNVVCGSAGGTGSGQISDLNRSGAVPTRVDTWGSLAAAQELAHKRVSSGSGGQMQQQQQQIQQQMSAGAQAVEAALAASSRRTSGADSFPSQAGLGAALAWQQQQQHGHLSGPRSGGSFTQNPYQHYQQQQQQQPTRRTSSGSGRVNHSGGPASSNGLEAAAAVAAALGHPAVAAAAGNLGLQGQFAQQSGGMTAIPEHQQQQQKQVPPGSSDAAVAVPEGAVGNCSAATADAAAGEPVTA